MAKCYDHQYRRCEGLAIFTLIVTGKKLRKRKFEKSFRDNLVSIQGQDPSSKPTLLPETTMLTYTQILLLY